MTYLPGVLNGGDGPVISTPTEWGFRLRTISSSFFTSPASTAWPANNDAYIIPFLLSVPTTFVRAFTTSGTSPGTSSFDLGIYSDAFALIRSTGATAMVNTTTLQQPAGGAVFTAGQVTLPRGRYYMAMAAASTALTVIAGAGLNGVPRLVGMQKMATAYPLPATFVPASMGASTIMPNIGLMTASGTIL